MSKIEDIVEKLAEPIAVDFGVYIWDVDFSKDILSIYIDKDGEVSIEDCENVSRELSKQLDAVDPIENPYSLEVSSPGLDRKLSRDWHFDKCIGKKVDVKLFKPKDGTKVFEGVLLSSDKESFKIKVGENEIKFLKAEASKVSLTIEF